MYLTLLKGTILFKLRYVLTPLIIAVALPFIMTIIELLDFYRGAMFRVDGGDMAFYTPVSTLGDFIVLGVQSAPYFLIKPFVWEASNILQLIQGVENLLLGYFSRVFWKRFKVDRLITFKWVLFLFLAMTIYGLVVFNYGTAVRYISPFIVMVVVGLSYELYRKYGYVIRLKIRWR